MNTSGKQWGSVTELFRGDFGVDRLIIQSGGYSSKHKHVHKNNRFYVLTGCLIVKQWLDGLMDETVLIADQSITIPAGIYHQFLSPNGCEAIEIMWVDGMRDSDIERMSHGGKK